MRTAASVCIGSDTGSSTSRRRFLLGSLAGLAGMTGAMPLHASSSPALVMVYFDDFAPLSLTTADGSARGLLVDAIDAIGRDRLGWALRHQAMPWGRAQLKLEMGDADGFCTLPTPERSRFCRFAAEPLFTLLVDGLVWRRDSRHAAALRQVSRLDALKNFIVADYIGNGWSQSHLAGWTNLRRRGSLEDALRLLDTGEADVLIQSRLIVGGKLRQMDAHGRFESRPVDFLPQSPVSLHVGLRRSRPDAEALMAAFETVQRDFLSSGAMAALVKRYTEG